ncbi:MAG TPA: redox-regulated ATPase YchF [Candidatus Nanoarchaeia archaeon]|nr:redox-regulated ATPase YchF [Candidatus Nanoarchaeia archaeon]
MLIGLVGHPSVGKSCFFKASTLANVEIHERPFTTLKSSEAIGYVKVPCVETYFNTKCDPRFGYCINAQRFVPITLMDVPGLVPGAHEGKGLGYEFLNDLSQADALIHVIDASGTTNAQGENIPDASYDPCLDIAFLEYEIDTWYYTILSNNWARYSRKIIMEKIKLDKAIAQQFSGLKITEEHVTRAIQKLNLNIEKPDSWTEKDLRSFCSLIRHYSKPIIIAANKIDKPTSKKNLEKLQQLFSSQYTIIPCSADSELALREASKAGLITYIPGEKSFDIIKPLTEGQQQALDYIKKNVLDIYGSTGVQDVLNDTVFKFLHYIAIFPGGTGKLEDSNGRRLPDCFLLPPGSTALDFAYKIHQDLGKNFVRAIDVKKKLPLGREHALKHLDVIEIKT